MSVNPPLIEFKKVNFSYGQNKILDNITFEIDKGSYLGIIGPNGGGKSTLVKVLLGLLKPDSGEIVINGNTIDYALDHTRIGYVPQRISQDHLDLPATVWEIVESGAIAKTSVFSSSDKKKTIEKAISVAGLGGKKNRLIGELSGGQRQKAFVARALAVEPEILVLDEPFVGVDLGAQKEFYAFLKMLNKEQKLTIIFISHDLDMITGEAQEILALNRKIVYTGKAEDVDEEQLVEGMYGKAFTHIHHD